MARQTRDKNPETLILVCVRRTRLWNYEDGPPPKPPRFPVKRMEKLVRKLAREANRELKKK